MGRSQTPGSQLQRPKRSVKSLTNRYLLAPEQASSTMLGAYRARAGPPLKSLVPDFKRTASSAQPHPAAGSLRLSRPWPPSLPREAGGAGEGRALAGGEYLLVRLLPSNRLLPSFLPGRATPGGAYCSVCSSGRAGAHPFATTDELGCYAWRSLCAHTPLGATAAIVVCLPTATHTPFLREGVDL